MKHRRVDLIVIFGDLESGGRIAFRGAVEPRVGGKEDFKYASPGKKVYPALHAQAVTPALHSEAETGRNHLDV